MRRLFLFVALLGLCLVACERDEVEPPATQASEESPALLLGPAHDTVFEAGGIQFKMVYVPAGTFTMGASSAYDPMADAIESPTHQVTLDDFLISEVEVPQLLYYKVMKHNPSELLDLMLPVNNLTFSAAERFLDTLSIMAGYRFRMPTEAEWEYAARAAGSAPSLFAGADEPDSVAWWQGNSEGMLHESGLLRPNALGLYDMSGNVMEWCSDWYGDYSAEAQTNPQGPARSQYTTQQRRVVRGGSYRQAKADQRCTCRQFYYPATQSADIGLRLVMSVAQ